MSSVRSWFLVTTVISSFAVLTGFASGLTAHAGERVVNGGFELPNISNLPNGGRGWEYFREIEGWRGREGVTLEIQDGCCGSSFAGDQHLELDSTSNSAVEQTVRVVPGTEYVLSLAYSPRPGSDSATNEIAISFDGSRVVVLAESGRNLGRPRWGRHSVVVVPDNEHAILELRGLGPSDGFGGYVDEVSLVGPDPKAFSRGDANADGRVNLSDALSILGCLFLGSGCPACSDAADANDDGTIQINDAVGVLNFLFLAGLPPLSPTFPACGQDPTEDELAPCAASAC